MDTQSLFEKHKIVTSILSPLLSTKKTTACGRQSNKSKAVLKGDGPSPAKTPRKRATPKKKQTESNKDDDEFVKSENHEMGHLFDSDERYNDANENFYAVGRDGEKEAQASVDSNTRVWC
jgi:hypothetical protein